AAALRAEHAAAQRVAEIQLSHRARDAHVEQAALLLEPSLLQRTRMRKYALLAPRDEHDRVLEPLGVMHGHKRHEPLLVVARVGVGEQRDLLQEALERVR